MDNLALSVSKSITDFLEQNEKRFVSQHTQQEQHDQLLVNLQAKIEQLETKCEDLASENKLLRDELDTLKQREDATAKDMITTKSDLEKMHVRVNECSEWVRLITALTQQVHNLNESRDSMEKEFKNIMKNQEQLARLAKKQQNQLESTTATANSAAAAAAAAAVTSNAQAVSAPHYSVINPNHRTPIRSPSTSSFFNGNMNNHSSIPRHKPQSSNNIHNHHRHYQRDEYDGSLDVNDEISEMSENAESLLRELQSLNDLHKSFERSSICSDDATGR